MAIRSGIVRFLLGTTLGVSVATLIAFNVLLAWVATGPRSLEIVTPYIEASFEPPDHKYSISIGETWLVWDGWKHPIDIRLRNVKIMTSEQRTYSRFPEISLGLDFWSLLRGRLLPTSLTIEHPVIRLLQNEDRSISFGLTTEAPESPESPESPPESPDAAGMTPPEMAVVPFSVVLAPLLAPDSGSVLRKLRYVSIVDADLSVSNSGTGVSFSADGADIVFRRTRHGLHAFGTARISYDNYQSDVTVQFLKARDSNIITGDVNASELMLGTLAELFGENTPLKGVKFPVSGKSSLTIDENGVLQELSFIVDGGKGTLESEHLDGVVPVSSLHAEGTLSNNAATIGITRFNADFDGILLEGDGAVTLDKDNTAVRGNVRLRNADAKDVRLLWPPKLAPLSREWVTTNILSGKVPQARAHIAIAAGDLAKPVLPREDVDATIELEGAKIRYLPDHPEVSAVKGVIRIDGVSLNADIESGRYLKDSKLSGGKLAIDDLNDDNPYIKIELDAECSAKDVVHFLSLPRLNHAGRLNLREETAKGTVTGHARLGFRFFAPRDEAGNPTGEADIDYDVAAQLKDVSQPGFMNKFDIQDANGTVTVNHDAVDYKGTGNVNGATVLESHVTYLFHPKDAFDTLIEVSALAPVDSLPRFGYPQFPFLKGTLGVKATVKEGEGAESAQAAIDLTDAAVIWPKLGINKPEKVAATLELTSEKKDGVATIPSFHFKGKDIDGHGAAELTQDLGDVRRVTMEKIINGKTRLEKLVYEQIEGGFLLEFSGSHFDATPWTESRPGEEGTFSFQHFPAVQFKGNVDKVSFGEGRELTGVKGELACNAQRCESANISGATADGKPFAVRILRNPKGARQFSLHAESAGVFLRSVNLFDGMEGGDLTVTGTFDDGTPARPGNVFRGRVDINGHTVKKVPVLAKILSLASLTGFFDTLQGNGIHFRRLNAPFTLQQDVITLDKAKTYGDAMGLTAEGTITFPKRILDIEGTVVPSYSLNNVLGKVPIVGAVLTGGEGQGVFAARYRVKGLSSDPEVTVNPLSILTPGFLRGLFDILDKPKKTKGKPETEAGPEFPSDQNNKR